MVDEQSNQGCDRTSRTNKCDSKGIATLHAPEVILERYSSRNREFDAYRRATEVSVSNWLPIDIHCVSAHPPYLHRRSNSEFIYIGGAERRNRV